MDGGGFGLGELRAADLGQDGAGLALARLLDEPAGAFGDAQEEEGEENGGEDAGGEHPAPAGLGEPGLDFRLGRVAFGVGDAVVDERAGGDAADDGDLVHRNQPAAKVRRGDFGDIHGSGNGRDADAYAADEAEEDEDPNVLGNGRADGRGEEQGGGQRHGRLASEAIRERADEEDAGSAAHEHAAGGPALHEVAQMEAGGERLDSAGDDAGVVTKEQSAEHRHEADG